MKKTYKAPATPISETIENLIYFQNAWVKPTETQDTVSLASYYGSAMERAIVETARIDATEYLKQVVVDSIPHLCELKSNRGERITNKTSKYLALLLLDKTLRTQLLTKQNGDKSLAWVCLQRAYDCEHGKIIDKEHVINNILIAWLDRGLPCPETPTLLDTVGVIYEGHYWAAEFKDYTYDRMLPNDLWLKNQPVHYGSPANSHEPQHALPPDLNM